MKEITNFLPVEYGHAYNEQIRSMFAIDEINLFDTDFIKTQPIK